MRVIILSDLHGFLPEIPSCDLLLICGDICPLNNHDILFQENWLATSFVHWIEQYAANSQVVVISGNHDKIFERRSDANRLPSEFLQVATYLEDSACFFQGLKIYGTPWSQKIGKWAFSLGEKTRGNPFFTLDQYGDYHRIKYDYVQKQFNLENRFALIPDDTDILLTHSPPWGIADIHHKDSKVKNFIPYQNLEKELQKDKTKRNHLGSVSLRKRVWEVQPLLHSFGHIHTSSGIWQENNTFFVNASYLDNDYQAKRKIQTIKL